MVKPRGRVRDRAMTARRRSAKSPKSAPDSGDAVASLQAQLDQRTRELREAQEQQAATSEVLKVISSSPGELGVGIRNNAGERNTHLPGHVRRHVFLRGRRFPARALRITRRRH